MSEEKIVGLDGKPVSVPNPNVNDGLVSLLEEILADVKTGKIRSAIVCYTTPAPDGELLYQTSWAGSQITLLGAINRASYALNRGLDGQDKGWIGNDG